MNPLPSALQSASFHILLNTEFGSFDLINSVLAAIIDRKIHFVNIRIENRLLKIR